MQLYSAIFLNLVPIVAKWSGRMKFFGALLCMRGTLLVSLLKGRILRVWPTGLLLLQGSHAHAPASPTGAHHNMVAGTLFLCGSCVGYSLWLIIQVRVIHQSFS
jgi:hypothetical protein